MSDVKYQQLQTTLLQELEEGKFHPGERFYSEKELSTRFGLSCGTVIRTLNRMTEDGYLERRPRLGTFVKDSPVGGRVMTRPLYLNTLSMFTLSNRNRSTFVFEEIRRGIINNYPGPVRLETFQELVARQKRGEKITTVLIDSGDYLSGMDEYFTEGILVNLKKGYQSGPNRVEFEPFSGIFAAVAHLARECGRRRIGFIGGDKADFFAERFFAYRTALESLGIPYRESLVIRNLVDSASDAAEALLSLPDRPDAIFADSDGKSRDVIDAALKHGLRIPEDVAVVGFDDAPGTDSYTVPITSVHVPYCRMGEIAVRMLLERLRTGKDIPSENIPCTLEIRDSTRKQAKRSAGGSK